MIDYKIKLDGFEKRIVLTVFSPFAIMSVLIYFYREASGLKINKLQKIEDFKINGL